MRLLPLSSHVSRRPPPADVVVRHRRQTRPPRASPHVMYLSSTSSSSSSSSSPPEALGTCGNWSAYIDESKGLVYYFNPRTGESRWEPPSGTDFSDVRTNIGTTKRREMRTRLRNYLEDRLNESASEFVGSFSDTSVVDDGSRISGGARTNMIGRTNNIVAGGGNAETRNKYIVSEWGRYQALIDDKRGLIYYHDTWTRESSWERPEGFPPFKLSASRRIALEERNRRYLEWHGDSDGGNMPQGSDENAAVVSDANHSNDGTMESPEFAPE
ncbi:hypothetical protein ACHAXA_008671 [Cyclostephanos tholiformis]|uniref:WW domain-containing protein n=1 Tax=Cyclostephanos tholiformis TaxID=382380 RepID=A0ABD3R0C9_9STRA